MTDERSTPRSEQPRSEPEIIPPGAPLRRPRDDAFDDGLFSQRVYVARLGNPLGPFGFIMLAIAFAVVAVVVLALVVGAVLFWLPIVALIIALAMFSGSLRARWRRWR